MAVVATPRALQRLDTVVRPRTSPLRSVMRSVVRRRAFVLAGLLGTLLPALLLTLLQDDRYRGTSTLLLQRTSVDELVQLDTPAGDPAERRMNNEIGVIEGVSVRSLVLTRLGLDDAPRAHAIGDPDSDVIAVRVEGATAELAARLTNAYVDAYIDLRRTENLQLAGTAVVQLQEVIDGLQVQIAELDQQLAAADLADADALAADRAQLAADLSEYTDRLRRVQLDVELGLPPAEVLESAQPPAEPFAPDRLRILVAALSAGLALGLVAAFVIDSADDTLHEVDDVHRLTTIGPVLAAVPVDPSAGTPPLALVRSSDPAATAYRMLRNQLVAMDRSRQVVSVTSLREGGGASTTAANLGVAFAEHGDSVVVVDADLRTPSIHRIFGVDGSLGVVDSLADESIEMASLPLDERLTVIAAGAVPPDPAALLATASFEQFVAELRRRFRYVVLDSAPLDAGSDAALVARCADAVVVVAAMADDRARDLDRAVRELAETGAPVAGIVANRVQRRRVRAQRP